MEKPLVKFYGIFFCALVLAVLFLPHIMGRTSAEAVRIKTYATLLAYNKQQHGPEAEQGKAHAVFIMDDGWETQYTNGYRILSKYDMKGCIAVIPAAVGQAGYVNYKQLAEMYMAGWDMLNHTYNHMNLEQEPAQTQVEQVVKGKQWLEQHQLTRGADVLVFPNGKFSFETMSILAQKGCVAARSLNSLWVSWKQSTLENVEACNLISHMSFGLVKNAIDKAIANKSNLILILHKVEPVTADTYMQVEEAFLEQVAEYLAQKQQDIQVVTMTELLELLKKTS